MGIDSRPSLFWIVFWLIVFWPAAIAYILYKIAWPEPEQD